MFFTENFIRKKVKSNFKSQYKFLYDFVRNSLSGKYENNGLNGTLPVGEVTGVSETFERLSSAELVDDDPHDPIRKMVSTQKSVKLIRRTNKAFFISYTHKLPYLGSDHILQNNFFFSM